MLITARYFLIFCCIPTNGQILPLSNMLNGYQTEQKIRKCKANSVFDALQTLDGILTDHPSRNFVLIPLGTRPHSAACAIFASRCQNVRIIYDYAQESPVCSRGVRSATIYNVSQYLI